LFEFKEDFMKSWQRVLTAVLLMSSLVVSSSLYAATTELLSVTSTGDPVNAQSVQVSDDGRFVLFSSDQPNIVSGITPNYFLVYIHDRQTGKNELVSADANGTPLPAQNTIDFMRRSMSTDGRYAIFSTYTQVYVKDRLTGGLKCVSVDNSGNMIGGSAGTISADGQTAAFTKSFRVQIGVDLHGQPKYASWTEAYLNDLTTGVVTPLTGDFTPGKSGYTSASSLSLSADGRYLTFLSSLPLPEGPGIYVYDTVAKAFERIDTNNLNACVTDIYGGTTCDYSEAPTISNDGRYVSYQMYKMRLESSGDSNWATQIFIADRTTKTFTRADFPYAYKDGALGGGGTYPAISADGNHVIFLSYTDRLNSIGGGVADIFVFERASGNISRVDLSTSGEAANDGIYSFAVNADASSVVFNSNATNLVPGVGSGSTAIFVRNTEGQGYPLTFTVTKAEYNTPTQTLTIEVTSTKGANSAGLEALNIGAMSWDSAKSLWTYSATVATQPASVVVGNIEGYKTVAVNVVTPPADVTPPTVLSFVTSGASGSTAAIALSFSENVTMTKNLSMVVKIGTFNTVVTGTGSLYNISLMSCCRPLLKPGVVYTLTIPAGSFRDSAGNLNTAITTPVSFGTAPVPVNGVCGSSNGAFFLVAPTANLCNTGAASAVSGAGSFAWTCGGSNGGTTASCSAKLQAPPADVTAPIFSSIVANGRVVTITFSEPVTAVRPAATLGGRVLAYSSVSGNTATFQIKSCCTTLIAGASYALSVPAGAFKDAAGNPNAAISVSATPTPLPAVNGTCGSSNGAFFLVAPTTNLCTTGTASAVSGAGPFAWSCGGSNGGTTASCSAQLQAAPPADVTAPTVVSTVITGTSISSDVIKVTFTEAVTSTSKTITIGTAQTTYSVSGSVVRFKIKSCCLSKVKVGNTYNLVIPAGSFKDAAGNLNAAISIPVKL
jgi:hypothetical protein